MDSSEKAIYIGFKTIYFYSQQIISGTLLENSPSVSLANTSSKILYA